MRRAGVFLWRGRFQKKKKKRGPGLKQLLKPINDIVYGHLNLL